MSLKKIYYCHPLVFDFKSGVTSQVIRDSVHLARRGCEVFLFGTYSDEAAFDAIRNYIGDASVRLMVKKGADKRWRGWFFILFMIRMMLDFTPGKTIIARQYGKISQLLLLRPFLRKPFIILELHENAFPHLMPPKHGRSAMEIKNICRKVIERADGLSLTNHSQEVVLKAEFKKLPPYVVFPNGVEWKRFSKARPGQPDKGEFVVTYTGQFTGWKNIELLFKALALLDERFTLRIAGGKGDEASRKLIEDLTARHGLEGRVDYRGFVAPESLVPEVIDGSSVLALPLGDNMESRWFTSPMKLFEYMATGIPVVAVDMPSVRLITGGDAVYLSENEPGSFAGAIMSAVTSPDREERVERMNAIGRRYTYEKRAAAIDAFLAGLRQDSVHTTDPF